MSAIHPWLSPMALEELRRSEWNAICDHYVARQRAEQEDG